MIKVEKIKVEGFEFGVEAMRHSYESYEKSDSYYEPANFCDYNFVIGDNDLDLMRRLYKAGTEHRTYSRMIVVWMVVTAPLYFWKEADRYSVGKTQISTSTMHSIHKKPFEVGDFSNEHLDDESINAYYEQNGVNICLEGSSGYSWLIDTIALLNAYREKYLETKNKNDWWQLIQMLPSNYNQKRSVMMSYEVVFKMIKERSGHKLDEWVDFVEILKDLPYVREIIEGEQG